MKSGFLQHLTGPSKVVCSLAMAKKKFSKQSLLLLFNFIQVSLKILTWNK